MKSTLIVVMAMILLTPTALTARADAVRITGVITAIDQGLLQIVVDDIKVQITPNTEILVRDEAIAFDALVVGMTVKVCGHMDGDILKADQIMVKYLGK